MSDQEIQAHPQLVPQTYGPTLADDDLQRREQGYRLLVENTTDVIWSIDLNLKRSYVSPSIQPLTGFTAEEVVDRGILDLLTPASADLAKRTLTEALAVVQEDSQALDLPHTLELEMIRKDGSTVWVEVRTSFLRDKAGNRVGILGITRDISKRLLAETSLRRSEQRYRVLTETTGDWVWEIDAEGRYAYASPKIKDLLNYEPEEVLGKTPYDLMPPDEAKRIATLFRRIIARRVPFVALENTLLHKNGSRVVVETTGAPFFDAEGRFLGYQGCDRDVTDRKRAERELKEYSAALESTNKKLESFYDAARAATKAKSDFLANMSHEIRTPMTAILGYADILLGSLRNPDDLEAVQTIKRNGVYLLDLINDILDLSKIEAGKLDVNQTSCSPWAVLSEVVSLMRVRAAARNLSLEMECPGPIPATIQSDPLRLQQVLINLVGNAVKFTSAGQVRVVAHLIEGDEGQAKMQFDVTDTGIGMAADQMARLFQPFAQGDSSTSRKFGGTGLGLVISKRLAEILGGDITVRSVVGKGSTFSLTVAAGPLHEVPMITNLAEAIHHTRPTSQPPDDAPVKLACRLLLAEDGPDNQRLISLLLRKAGAEVELAENGRIALDLALAAGREGAAFDLILMDMQMPVMDGYEATRRLRAEGFTAPIIALTAHAMAGDRERCLEAGCDDYISKPVERTSLLTIVARHLKNPASSLKSLIPNP